MASTATVFAVGTLAGAVESADPRPVADEHENGGGIEVKTHLVTVKIGGTAIAFAEGVLDRIWALPRNLVETFFPAWMTRRDLLNAAKRGLMAKAESGQLKEAETALLQLLAAKEAPKIGNQLGIAARVAERLAGTESAGASRPPDPDWLERFWADAEHVTTEEMADIYAAVLEQEVREGGVSRQVLSVLRDLDRQTAELFSLACSCSINGAFLPSTGGDIGVAAQNMDRFLDERGLAHAARQQLEGVGLLHYSSPSRVTFPDAQGRPAHLALGPFVLRFQPHELGLQMDPLSLAGVELARLNEVDVDFEYLLVFLGWLRHQQKTVALEIAFAGKRERAIEYARERNESDAEAIKLEFTSVLDPEADTEAVTGAWSKYAGTRPSGDERSR